MPQDSRGRKESDRFSDVLGVSSGEHSVAAEGWAYFPQVVHVVPFSLLSRHILTLGHSVSLLPFSLCAWRVSFLTHPRV